MDKLTGIMLLRKRWKRDARSSHRHREGEAGHASRGDRATGRKQGVPVRFETAGRSTDWPIRKITRRGGAGAARAAASLEDILAHANAGHGQPGLIVLLDGVEDPHNLGAIIRTALAAGAHGVVIPERRAAGLTDTVARASAGALAHLPVAKVTNLVRAMEELKEAVLAGGLDEQADKNYTEVDYASPVGIVSWQRRARLA